ncbi:MAG: hypothetical protein AAGG38_14540 [Planctomycetota bacterium]
MHMIPAAVLSQSAATPPPTPSPTGVSPDAPQSMGEAFRNFFDTVAGMFSKGDALAQPEHVITHLQALGAVWSVVFVIVGALCMFNGYKFYRLATVGVALMLGMFAGYWFGGKIGAPYVVAGCLGVLMATLAFPLMKYAVAVFGGLTGAFVGANLWAGLAHAINKIATDGAAAAGAGGVGPQTIVPANAYWLGALLGLLICGMLAFILFKLSVVMFTSVSGSTIAVMGVLALLLSFEPWRDTVADGLKASQLVIPLLVFVPAAIGLIMQEAGSGGLLAGEGRAGKDD